MKKLPVASSIGVLLQYARLTDSSTRDTDLLQTESNDDALKVLATLSIALQSFSQAGGNTSANIIEAVSLLIYSALNNVLHASQSIVTSSATKMNSATDRFTSTLKDQSDSITKVTNKVANSLLQIKVPSEKMTILDSRMGVSTATHSPHDYI